MPATKPEEELLNDVDLLSVEQIQQLAHQAYRESDKSLRDIGRELDYAYTTIHKALTGGNPSSLIRVLNDVCNLLLDIEFDLSTTFYRVKK